MLKQFECCTNNGFTVKKKNQKSFLFFSETNKNNNNNKDNLEDYLYESEKNNNQVKVKPWVSAITMLFILLVIAVAVFLTDYVIGFFIN